MRTDFSSAVRYLSATCLNEFKSDSYAWWKNEVRCDCRQPRRLSSVPPTCIRNRKRGRLRNSLEDRGCRWDRLGDLVRRDRLLRRPNRMPSCTCSTLPLPKASLRKRFSRSVSRLEADKADGEPIRREHPPDKKSRSPSLPALNSAPSSAHSSSPSSDSASSGTGFAPS